MEDGVVKQLRIRFNLSWVKLDIVFVTRVIWAGSKQISTEIEKKRLKMTWSCAILEKEGQ